MLLAAAIPAKPGQWVLEGGAGAGAALLCLAARAGPLAGIGIERDQRWAQLAQENALTNGFPTIRFVAADVEMLPVSGPFDHAFANPPYHRDEGTVPASMARQQAKRARVGLFADWAAALATPLRHGGSLTFIITATVLPTCMAAFENAGCGPRAVFPLWPKTGDAAKLVLLSGRKGGRAPCRLLAGLALHERNGQFTPEAEAVLRHSGSLDL
ncbi:MAG: methyltransferase domain-containing protein [Acetobacteraceae bacterium]|nr:methyltransferase domain-containing protein [Acetobacteraceae bacterium]